MEFMTSASPNLKEVETQVVRKMTAGATCPVDGQLGAAYVHGLTGEVGANRCWSEYLLMFQAWISPENLGCPPSQ